MSDGVLRCQKCPAGQPLGDIAGYLCDGWPQRCGMVMQWMPVNAPKPPETHTRNSSGQ